LTRGQASATSPLGMARHDYDLRTPAPKDYAAPDLVTLDFGLFRSISSAQT